MKPNFICLIAFVLWSVKSFAQTSSIEKSCYINAAFVDSISGQPVAETLDLRKQLPTLLIKDRYKCNCTVLEYQIILMRGKRPVISWKTPVSKEVLYINLQQVVAMSSVPVLDQDRIMIEITKSSSGSTKCLAAPAMKIFTAKFVN